MRQSDRAPGLWVGDGVEIADDVEIGVNVVIHDGVVIGPGCRVLDAAILGKAPALWASSRAPRAPAGPLVLEAGVTVGTRALVFAGTRIGEGTAIGDQAYVREGSRVGRDCLVATLCQLSYGCEVGDRVRLMNASIVVPDSVVEDDVFVGPTTISVNDESMGLRRGERSQLRPLALRRACRIGGNVTLLPGVEVGEEAVVAAGAVVRHDVAPRTLVMGVPARPRGEVTPDGDLRR